ncbi:MAG: aldose epimerase [Kiritimatiellia bacterium]|nr:aldose epimerase [Kiritimatiellia bacterium]
MKMTQHHQNVWRIQTPDGGTTADFIPEWGGIGSSLVVPSPTGPRELLYTHDFFWDLKTEKTRGGLPFLFPACGRLERDGEPEVYLYEGRRYRLPIHGFSLRVPWQVIDDSRDNELTLRLVDSEATRVGYPFSFELDLTYRVETGLLVCHHRLRNTGSGPMPYNLGFHPYFLTPEPGNGKEKIRVSIPARRRLVYNERLTDLTGEAPPLITPVSIADPAANESLHEVVPGKPCRMTSPDGFAMELDMGSSDDPALYRYVQMYTMPDKPFFCIEPWTGHPNALNTAGGPQWLPPGRGASGFFQIRASR